MKIPTLETNFYPILIRQILLYNRRPNKPLKTYLWNFTTFLHGTALILESIQSSKYNSHRKTTGLLIVKAFLRRSTLRTTSSWNLPYYISMESSQHYPSANMPVQYSHKGNQMENYAFWLTSENATHLSQMITSTTTIRSAH